MLTKRVHNYAVHPVTGQLQMLEIRPYVRLAHRDFGCVYLQDGHCFADAGEEIDLPDWAAEQLAHMSPHTLREVKFEPEPEALPVEPAPPAMFHCPDCDVEVELTRKGVHIAAHRRAARKGE